MKDKILTLLKEIELLKNNISADNKLPADTYYLNDDEILCMSENNANIRYPYEMDGMNLWAYSNGHIDACESKFVIFRTAYFNSSSLLGFWGGVKRGENEWFPLSIQAQTSSFLSRMILNAIPYSEKERHIIFLTVMSLFLRCVLT